MLYGFCFTYATLHDKVEKYPITILTRDGLFLMMDNIKHLGSLTTYLAVHVVL